MSTVHHAYGYRVKIGPTDDDWVIKIVAQCGILNVVEHWWTINDETYTCETCKAAPKLRKP